MPSVPGSLALTSIADGSLIIAADHRNNYAAIQTGVNGLETCLSGGTANQVLKATSSSAVAYDFPPGYEYAYNEFTSNVTVTATTEGTANTVVTASAVTFDGATPAMIEFFSLAANPDAGAAGRALFIWLYQDGSSIGEFAQLTTPAAATLQATLLARRRITPASGSRTYSIRASVNAGTGTVSAGAGGTGLVVPGYIRITKV